MNNELITLLYKFQKAIKKINQYWLKNGRTDLLKNEIERFELEIMSPMDTLWEKQTPEEKHEFLKAL